MTKTKIICTIGPASRNEHTLKEMIKAGMSVARLNFSHGDHTSHKKTIDLIKKLNSTSEKKIKILQDLEGYRIRIGKLKNDEIPLEKDQIITLTNVENQREGAIYFDYEGSLLDIKENTEIYIDDGNITIKVLQTTNEYIKAKVIIPGVLKTNKGVNMPNVVLAFSGVKEKDRKDMLFGIEQNVDLIAQSFVRKKEDILNVKKIIGNRLDTCKVIAKIECREGINNIDEILDVSDGIMIARGDMGVSIPIYQIPIVQKMIIRKCNQKKKFVVTATQMLESMTLYHRPTRAEVSDVANAVIDGTDFVMLSGETAVGKYPIKTVKMMQQIIEFSEKNIHTL